jgi:hypothetical protein
MISNALRTDIEIWAGRRDQNPMFQMAREGTLTQSMVTRYIANVTYMIRLTAGHLRAARDGARAVGDETLAAHYEHKLEEEIGHDVWGEADLVSLEKVSMGPANVQPTPSIERLGTYLTDAIAEDPALYLCYLALTEYITALLGPELLSLIEKGTGVPRSSMTVIDNHIELDREHSEEAWGIIDDLVGDPRKITRMRGALAEMVGHFDGFCVELTNKTERSDESGPRIHQHVVSAA